MMKQTRKVVVASYVSYNSHFFFVKSNNKIISKTDRKGHYYESGLQLLLNIQLANA